MHMDLRPRVPPADAAWPSVEPDEFTNPTYCPGLSCLWSEHCEAMSGIAAQSGPSCWGHGTQEGPRVLPFPSSHLSPAASEPEGSLPEQGPGAPGVLQQQTPKVWVVPRGVGWRLPGIGS